VAYEHLSDKFPCKTHTGYRLNCEQYEALRAESGGGCQICGFPAEKMPQRKLYIDHIGGVPNWMVRGLLCISCNSRLEGGVGFSDAAALYLQNAWHLRQCAVAGVPLEGGPEPEVGVDVVDNFDDRWTRRWGSWLRVSRRGPRGVPRDWRRLNCDLGPFNLRPATTTDASRRAPAGQGGR